MKKLLVILLAGAMLAGFALPASAAPEPGVKTVTKLEAVWTGDPIVWELWNSDYIAADITLTYEDGSSDTYDYEEMPRYGGGDDDWWYVRCLGVYIDDAKVTLRFVYEDSVLRNAFLDGLNPADNLEAEWDAHFDSLPQVRINPPCITMEEFIESQKPLIPLKPGEEITLTYDKSWKVFAFTPEKSGPHVSFTGEWTSLRLFNAEYEPVGAYGLVNWFIMGSMVAELEAGETYYLLVRVSSGSETIVLYGGAKRLDFWQWLKSFLTFGIFREMWISLWSGENGIELYAVPIAIPGSVTPFQLLIANPFMLLAHLLSR